MFSASMSASKVWALRLVGDARELIARMFSANILYWTKRVEILTVLSILHAGEVLETRAIDLAERHASCDGSREHRSHCCDSTGKGSCRLKWKG